MTSLSNICDDLSKIITDARWMIDDGFNYRLAGYYTLQFYKDNISIEVYYGRYSDLADVTIKIDDIESDRQKNGELVKYSVFESFPLNKEIKNNYQISKHGLDIIKTNKELLSIEFLKKIRKEYKNSIRKKLPENIRKLVQKIENDEK